MSVRRKILFVTPPYHCGVVEVAGRWMPLTFVYLAGAARRAGLDAEIYDAMTKRHGFREIEARIRETKPDYVATTAITSTIPDALRIMGLAKTVDRNIITLIGGVHPTFCFEEVLASGPLAPDFVVRGEGETTLAELLLALESGRSLEAVRGLAYRENGTVRVTGPRCFVPDLDALTPAWDLIEWKEYTYYVIPDSRLAVVSTSRGCNHDCTFCSQQKFWERSWRARNPGKVVEEIEHLYTRYGANVFLIADEYPTRDRQRWEEFLDLLILKNLPVFLLMETRVEDIVRDRDILSKYRQAGIVHVYIGIEATEQDTLDLIRKDLRVEQSQEAIRLLHAHGMITETSFVLGFPHETKRSVARTLKWARFYNPDFAHFLAITPWPYADLYHDVKEAIRVFDYRKYNLIDPIIQPRRMSLADVDRAIVDCYRKFYMGKLPEMANYSDPFKRRYLLTSMHLIMRSSFLVNKLGSLGKVPAAVEAYLHMERPAHLSQNSVGCSRGEQYHMRKEADHEKGCHVRGPR